MTGGEQSGPMGSSLTKEQQVHLDVFPRILKFQNRPVSPSAIATLLKWISKNVPEFLIIEFSFDGTKLAQNWVAATTADKTAAELLPVWRQISEALKQIRQGRANSSDCSLSPSLPNPGGARRRGKQPLPGPDPRLQRLPRPGRRKIAVPGERRLRCCEAPSARSGPSLPNCRPSQPPHPSSPRCRPPQPPRRSPCRCRPPQRPGRLQCCRRFPHPSLPPPTSLAALLLPPTRDLKTRMDWSRRNFLNLVQ